MKHLLAEAGMSGITVESAALHTDEIGSDIHHGTRRLLRTHGIPFTPRSAWLLTAESASEYDLIIGMDAYNMRDLHRLVSSDEALKLHCLSEFSGTRHDIADPWYTDDFETTYSEVSLGCAGLLEWIQKHVHSSGRP